MNKQRPINLDLFTIKFPLPAIVSILHRISGVLVFFLIPLLLWMLQVSLVSPGHFINLQNTFSGLFPKLMLWGFLAALLYHLVAGIRHLLMDVGIGESLEGGRFSARLVVILSVILIILVGIWLW